MDIGRLRRRQAALMIHAKIRVSGQVQGVGFRPFVFRLARELDLAGWVRNDGEGVEIRLEGEDAQISRLILRMHSDAPKLARIDRVEQSRESTLEGFDGFCIAASRYGPVQTGIAPDTAICPECLRELFDAADRRYRHPFINCIHCGPRYTLTARMPYDRANTSMAGFEQCPACMAEYVNPATRRFHAQPNACPDCGPGLTLYDATWNALADSDPIADAACRIWAGKIVAVKGVGGYHLMLDARNDKSIAALRNLKQRDEKPFAVMALNARSARRYAIISDLECELLQSSERPIVLLSKSPLCDDELPGIAQGLSDIGLMLPCTPLHYLLFHELLGRPHGHEWLGEDASVVLVATSANQGGEPLVSNEADARLSLTGLADAFLTHDREILHRCDDSVIKWQRDAPVFVRRARGYVPRRIMLPFSGPSVLACGAWLKNTVCLTRGNEAFVSEHIGDLGSAKARSMLDDTVEHLCDILDIRPQIVAHDLHPDFYSTHFAQRYASERNLQLVGVQHHHAHIAAVCADRIIAEPVLGLALDGTGLGTDGTAWGGELLRVDAAGFERLGHLAKLRMPGGDRAAEQPWRMAASALFELGRCDEIGRRYPDPAGAALMAMLQRASNCPPTSSMGRSFDAAAGLLGVSRRQGYEGQAAMLLEALASRRGNVAPMQDGYSISDQGVLDFKPLYGALADCTDPASGAALYHSTVALGLAEWVMRAADRCNIRSVALGGGCFLNGILSNSLSDRLTAQGMKVLAARQLPPGDGGISLGQAAVALQRINSGDAVQSMRVHSWMKSR